MPRASVNAGAFPVIITTLELHNGCSMCINFLCITALDKFRNFCLCITNFFIHRFCNWQTLAISDFVRVLHNFTLPIIINIYYPSYLIDREKVGILK